MNSGSFQDHFSGVAAEYARHRPGYPEALFDWLVEVSPGTECAVDLAAGSGQAARGLAGRFRRVVAVDASAEQVVAAPVIPGVTWRVGRAEDPGEEPWNADLVVVAQALHWFDRESFFAHLSSWLRPGGVLAAWTYQLLVFDDPAIDERIHAFYDGTVGPYWPPERALVEDGYRSLDWPLPEIPAPAFAIERDLTLAELAGYLGTWSAVSRYRADRGHDPVAALAGELRQSWGEGRRRTRWPLALRAGCMPEDS